VVLKGAPSRRDADHRNDSLAAFGLAAELLPGQADAADDQAELEVWPENLMPVALFIRMSGQWRMGPGGPIALDYGALHGVAYLMRVSNRELRRCFEPLREMEAEALVWFGEQRAQNQQG
jgi:hypothetical protein